MGASDSKVLFREQVLRIYEEDIAEEDNIWKELITLPTSIEDIFSMMYPDELRNLITNRRSNFTSLVKTCIEHLESFEVSEKIDEEINTVRNWIRILTRVTPFTFEYDQLDDFWWTSDKFGYRLLCVINQLLFMPQYSIYDNENDIRADDKYSVNQDVLWKHGLVLNDPVPIPSQDMYARRTEILKLLMATLSGNIYVPIAEQQTRVNLWKWVYCSSVFPRQLNLYYSLINVVITSDIGGYSWIPYSSYLNVGEEEKHVESALQVLTILLDFLPPSEEQVEDLQATGPGAIAIECIKESPSFSSLTKNGFIDEIWNISSMQDITLIYEGILKTLQNYIAASNTYFPGSIAKSTFYQEIVLFLWKIIEINTYFIPTLLQNSEVDILQMYSPLLYIFDDNTGANMNYSLLNIITFILLQLSGERGFAIALNSQYKDWLPASVSVFKGSHADLTVQLFSQLMLKDTGNFDQLYSCLLIVIANISPYIRNITKASANSLVQLLEKFSQNEWVFSAPTRHEVLLYILETVNNLIQYQWELSQQLVIILIRKKAIIEGVWNLQLSSEPVQINEQFEPDVEWFNSWKSKLPLEVIMGVLNHLLPKVGHLLANKYEQDDAPLLEILADETTMAGVIPTPHPIYSRKFQQHTSTQLWMTAYIWGIMFMKNQEIPLFDGNAIKLFNVRFINSEEE